MGELEYEELGEGEPFVEPATDVERLQSSPPQGDDVVSRFFNADGSVRENPDLKTDAGLQEFWGAKAAEQEAEQASRGPSALEAFDPGPESQEAAYADWQAHSEAASWQAQRENEQALAERIARMAKAEDVDTSDREGLAQLQARVSGQVSQWVGSQLAAGATGRQIAEATQGFEWQQWLDERIGEGLREARYRQTVRHTPLGKWVAARDAAMEQEHLLGGPPPQQLWERYPYLQRMWNAMSARAERQADQQQYLRAIRERTQAYNDLHRSEIEARERELMKPRKLRH